MHPYYWHRPSRLLWFFIGAASATWWIKSKEAHHFKVRHCARHQIPQDAYPPPNTSFPLPSPEVGAPPANNAPAAGTGIGTGAVPVNGEERWGWGRGAGVPPPTDRWEEERQRMQNFGKQAQETVTDLSEATLDTLLTTVESLKAKLAEHRAEREQQAREIEALREEKMRQFEEWKKQQPPSSPPSPRHTV